MNRSAGILLPVFSLPSPGGIGCFDAAAYRFVDWLETAGQRFWQMLPLGPTGYGDSPYQSFSAFAGNPYFISPEALAEEGLLTREEAAAPAGAEAEVDYARLRENRMALLALAHSRSRIARNTQFRAFCREEQWLSDYALFMALKEHFGGGAWSTWPEKLRRRDAGTLAEYRHRLAGRVEFWEFVQFCFYRQWDALHRYANAHGVGIIGDIPIYAAYDSADVWALPALFQLDEAGVPLAVAGCPPDGFAAEGQLWGNPLYDWRAHAENGYTWWISRLAQSFRLYDTVRIDHFRGFDEYYAIPAGEKTAVRGHWEPGPGAALFHAMEAALGRRDIIAEDLGFVTDSVRALVRSCGFPNMKVLQFAFDTRDTGSRTEHQPHGYAAHCVAYTGTHDNQPLRAWLEAIPEAELGAVRDYLCDAYTPTAELVRPLIALLLRSSAGRCIIPMQDWLSLGDGARMNTPATLGGNWKWRVPGEALCGTLAAEIRRMTAQFGRLPEQRKDERI